MTVTTENPPAKPVDKSAAREASLELQYRKSDDIRDAKVICSLGRENSS
jgi:hypothetical protein